MKAILVIEKPRYCCECPCLDKENYYCQVNAKYVDTGIPLWCPLKPMPQKKKPNELGNMSFTKAGYNQCIDEILGEQE